MSLDTSSSARKLRHLIYDRIMSNRATPDEIAESDRIAALLFPAMVAPSAGALLDLERLGRACFARLDRGDKMIDYNS